MSPSISSAPLSVPYTRLLFEILLAIALTTTIFTKCALALKPASKPQEWIYKNSKGGWDHMELCFWAKTRWDCNMVPKVACPPRNTRRYCKDLSLRSRTTFHDSRNTARSRKPYNPSDNASAEQISRVASWMKKATTIQNHTYTNQGGRTKLVQCL
ncbi:hypothetical protein MTO96_036792 [Rhipicephalus appendiculatus]